MIRKSMSLLVVTAVIGLAIAVGCASTPAPQPSTSASTKPATQSSAPASPAASPAASASAKPAPKPPTTPAEMAVYQGSDRQQLLEAGARKEGTLTWYSMQVGTVIQAHIDGFKKKYPFLQVEMFRATSPDIATKIMQEAQAGQHVFDTVNIQKGMIRLLAENKLVMPYYSPGLASIPDNLKTGAANNTVQSAADSVSYYGFGYNTNVIPENAVPKTFQDLLRPELTGKLAMTGTQTGWVVAGAMMQALGEEKGRQLLQDLGDKQKMSLQQISGGALLDLIAKGEVPASPTIFDLHARQVQSKGGPVKWVPLEPVAIDIYETALSAKPQHPYAALLWIDYLLSDEGRKVYAENFMENGTEKKTYKVWDRQHAKSTAQIDQELKLWSDAFKAALLR